MTIFLMDSATLLNIIQDAFNAPNCRAPGGNQAFQIVHYLLGETTAKVTDDVATFLTRTDKTPRRNVETQFLEKLQLRIMAFGNNSEHSSSSSSMPTTRLECLTDYLYKTVVDA